MPAAHVAPAAWTGLRRAALLAVAARHLLAGSVRVKLALTLPAAKAFVAARSRTRFLFPPLRTATSPRPLSFAAPLRTGVHAPRSVQPALPYRLAARPASAAHAVVTSFATEGFRAANPVNRLATTLAPSYRALRALTLATMGIRPAARLPSLVWARTLRMAANGLVPTPAGQARYFSCTSTAHARPSNKLPTTTLTVPLDPDLMFLMDGQSVLHHTLDREAQAETEQPSVLFAPSEEELWWDEAKTLRPGLESVQHASSERFALGARLGALEALLRVMSPAAAGDELVARLREAYARGAETLHVTLHGATIDEAHQLLSIIGWTGEHFYMLHQDIDE